MEKNQTLNDRIKKTEAEIVLLTKRFNNMKDFMTFIEKENFKLSEEAFSNFEKITDSLRSDLFNAYSILSNYYNAPFNSRLNKN